MALANPIWANPLLASPFGQPFLASISGKWLVIWPIWANPIWVSPFSCCCCIVVVLLLCVVVCGCALLCVVACCCVLLCVVACCWFGPSPPDAGPLLRRTTLRRTSLRQTPLRRTAQNFALFFPLPPPFRSFSLSGCLLVEFWPPGFHTTAREPKHAHLRVRALHTPPKFNEKTPKRGKKERKMWREREKSAKFWAPHPSKPHPSVPHPSLPPSPFGAPPLWAPP